MPRLAVGLALALLLASVHASAQIRPLDPKHPYRGTAILSSAIPKTVSAEEVKAFVRKALGGAP